jgi:hypothetical protein
LRSFSPSTSPVRTRVPSRPWRAALVVAAIVVLAGCHGRPDFDVERAQVDISSAFAVRALAVQVLGDGRGSDPDTWIVDFRLDGYDQFLQAKFQGREHKWQLDSVRERPQGTTETPWGEVGVILGRFRGATIARANQTTKVIRDLATLIERYSVEHSNKFPMTELEGVRKLVVGAGYIQESQWKNDADAWGNALAYHAAPDGQSYILLSPGADGRWDLPLAQYFKNCDEGMEVYGGNRADPNDDFIWATGSFVQVYKPD